MRALCNGRHEYFRVPETYGGGKRHAGVLFGPSSNYLPRGFKMLSGNGREIHTLGRHGRCEARGLTYLKGRAA